MSKTLEIGNSDFNKKVVENNKKVLVDFYAPWCSPCQAMEGVLEEVIRELDNKADVFKVNIDENSELAGKYNVMSLPTILIFEGGKIVDQLIGVNSKEAVLSRVS